MKWADAKKYCEVRGAKLPSKEDFIRLKEFMGADKNTEAGKISKNYVAQIFNRLKHQLLWSGFEHSPGHSFSFSGGSGRIYDYGHGLDAFVRCVVRPEVWSP